MNAPLVSVLIDTYNYGQFIEEAIQSVLAQDFPADRREIIVVDDGSTDDTPERVKKFGDSIRYIRKPNRGQASALNLGLEKTQGEIVAFLDADDYWLPGKLRRITEEFEKHPDVGMVYHKLRKLNAQAQTFEDGGLPLLSGFIPWNTKDLLSYVLYPASFLAFRRRALAPLLPIPEKLLIQADAHLSGLIIFLTKILAIPECLAVYRVHGQNLFAGQPDISKQRQKARLKTRRVLIDGMKTWLITHGFDLNKPDLRAFFRQWALTQERDQFAIDPPGRLRICRHLLEYAYFYGPQLTWRHRLVTYLNAAGSLLVGYKNVHRLDEWRIGIKRALGGSPQNGGKNPVR
jgi:glycosyltransferase involved in cell wall biosynthesis